MMKPVLKKIATCLMLIAIFNSSQSFSSDNGVSFVKFDTSIEKLRKQFFKKLIESYAPDLEYDNFCSTDESCDKEIENPELSAIKEYHLSSFADVSVNIVWSKNTNNPAAANTAKNNERSHCNINRGISLRVLRLFVDLTFDDLVDDYKNLDNKNHASVFTWSSVKRNKEDYELFDLHICAGVTSGNNK